MEALDQTNAGEDEEAAHQQSAENPPEKNAVLVLLGDGKIAEDYQEDKKIIDAEREFEYVAGDKLDGNLPALPEKNQRRQKPRRARTTGRSSQRIARTHNAAAPVEDEEIQHQHAQREQVEEDPEIEQGTIA